MSDLLRIRLSETALRLSPVCTFNLQDVQGEMRPQLYALNAASGCRSSEWSVTSDCFFSPSNFSPFVSPFFVCRSHPPSCSISIFKDSFCTLSHLHIDRLSMNYLELISLSISVDISFPVFIFHPVPSCLLLTNVHFPSVKFIPHLSFSKQNMSSASPEQQGIHRLPVFIDLSCRNICPFKILRWIKKGFS